ncbi:ferredoxin [soil metagenome]
MKVRVIDEKCQGHGRCYALAPDVFEADDYGNAHELHDGVVPAGLEDDAHLAVDNCPEYAIEVVEE